MKDKRTYTTISLQKITVKRMEQFGVFNETFDSLLNRMIDKLEGMVKK